MQGRTDPKRVIATDSKSDADATPIRHTHSTTNANGKPGTISHTHGFRWGEYAAHAIGITDAHPDYDPDSDTTAY